MKEGLSVQDLLAEVKRRSESKKDYTVATRDLVFGLRPGIEEAVGQALGEAKVFGTAGHQMIAGGHSHNLMTTEDRAALAAQGVQTTALTLATPKALANPKAATPTLNIPSLHVTTTLNKLAHDQLGTHLGIPARYYDRLLADFPALLADNVNTLLAAAPVSEKRLVRVLDGEARAFLSSSYYTLDNWDLVRFIMPLFRRENGKAVDTRYGPNPDDIIHALREPNGDPMNVQFRSCDVTDDALYIKVVSPSITGEVTPGDVVRAGVIIKNSEVGLGTLAVWPFYERLVCNNGAFITEWGSNKVGLTRRHVGGRDGANSYSNGDGGYADTLRDATKRVVDQGFFLSAVDTIHSVMTQTRFNQLLQPMKEAAGYAITGSPTAAVEVVGKTMNLTDTELENVTEQFLRGGDFSIWGISNAVTAAAKDVESYDRATELEGIGGRIITLPKTDWKEIAEAKPKSKAKGK